MKKRIYSRTEKEEIGKRIRTLRMQSGKSMKDFGIFLSPDDPIPQSIISRWERGISVPTTERLNLIAKKCNITVSFLLSGETDIDQMQILIDQLYPISIDFKKRQKDFVEFLNNADFSELDFVQQKFIDTSLRFLNNSKRKENEKIMIQVGSLIEEITLKIVKSNITDQEFEKTFYEKCDKIFNTLTSK